MNDISHLLGKIHNVDCLPFMRSLPDSCIDAIVTDPPYGLSFMGKHWDYDVPQVPVFTEMLRVLKPGGHLLCFGGSRTFHRIAVNIEDAGFDIRDTLMWLYGSGFPKSHNLKDDWKGWGTALKPAHEPIIMARKPLEGTVAANVLEYGTGAINIDGCRVETEEDCARKQSTGMGAGSIKYGGEGYAKGGNGSSLGRWPANVIHDGSEEVTAGFPESKSTIDKTIHAGNSGTSTFAGSEQVERIQRGDSGSAARFFYCAKTSKTDRNEGCEELEEKATASSEFRPNHTKKAAQGDSGLPYGRWTPLKNNHPTVKPTALMAYLCRLITPPNGIILDPYSGSGSTGKAATLEGFRFIGMEREAEYCTIANTRIAWAANERVEIANKRIEAERAQLKLF